MLLHPVGEVGNDGGAAPIARLERGGAEHERRRPALKHMKNLAFLLFFAENWISVQA
jgi:hypothetical protein